MSLKLSFFVPEGAVSRDPLSAPGVAPTVGAALALEELREGELLAGSSGLGRSITGPLALDAARLARYVTGGELLITTLPEGNTLEWLRELIQKGAAGIILLREEQGAALPEVAIALAEENQFPIVALPMTEDLKHLFMSLGRLGQRTSQSTHMAFSMRLTQLALDGAGLEVLAKTLSSELNAPILIEDRQFNLLAHAAPPHQASVSYDDILESSGTPLATLKELEDSGALQQLKNEKGLLTLPPNRTQGHPRYLCPMSIGGDVMGYLSCLDPHGRPANVIADALMAGSHGVAIELLKQKGIVENEQKLRRDFFRDLLFSNGNISPEALHRRATYLGYQLSSAYWAMVVEFDQVPNEELLPDEVKKLASSLNSLLSFRQALVITQTQGATILYPLKEGQPTLEKIKHLAETIRQKISNAPWSVSLGVGHLYGDLLAIPRSYREAQHAVKIGRALNGPNNIACFAELGIYRMLLQFAQSQNPNEFFCEALQRLLEYDQQADKELVKTLTAFLECNGNLTETSDRLYIHRNTLKYRLERIRDITQIDLDDSENRLMLHLGLKMNQIVSTLKR